MGDTCKAEQLLAEAWSSGCLNSFRDAVQRAESAKVEAAVLSKAKERLGELITRSEAELALADALAVSGLSSLRLALAEARKASVDATMIAKAQLRLDNLERDGRQ